MKADAAMQQRLLELAAIDTSLGQFSHQRASAPELSELAALATQIADAGATVAQLEQEQAGVDAEIAALEREIDATRTKIGRDQARMDAGAAAKELEQLGHEVVTLRARQTELEDAELEVMERQEDVASRLAAATTVRADLLVNEADTAKRRDERFADINAAVSDAKVGRELLAAEISDDLLSLYEKIRARGGVGAALLRAGRCQGCRLELSRTDLSAIAAAAADEVVRHDECGAILVRTAESGL